MLQAILLVAVLGAGGVLAFVRYRNWKKQRENFGATVLHVKGFARFYDEAKALKLAKRARQFIQELNPRVIVWDGDGFDPDSFTRTIQLDAKSGDKRDYRAYCFRGDILSARFDEWRGIFAADTKFELIGVDIVPTNAQNPDTKEYVALGLAAMKDSLKYCPRGEDKVHVLCLGVGPGVAQEIEAANAEGLSVVFHVLDTVRLHPSRGTESLHCFFPGQLPLNLTLIQ